MMIVSTMDRTVSFYSQPSYVGGVNFPIYAGSRRQLGGSGIFGALKNAVVPVLKQTGKTAGKQALGMAMRVASDAMAGKNIKQSLKENFKRSAVNVAKAGLKNLASSVMGAPPPRRQVPRKNVKRLGSKQRGKKRRQLF